MIIMIMIATLMPILILLPRSWRAALASAALVEDTLYTYDYK